MRKNSKRKDGSKANADISSITGLDFFECEPLNHHTSDEDEEEEEMPEYSNILQQRMIDNI